MRGKHKDVLDAIRTDKQIDARHRGASSKPFSTSSRRASPDAKPEGLPQPHRQRQGDAQDHQAPCRWWRRRNCAARRTRRRPRVPMREKMKAVIASSLAGSFKDNPGAPQLLTGTGKDDVHLRDRRDRRPRTVRRLQHQHRAARARRRSSALSATASRSKSSASAARAATSSSGFTARTSSTPSRLTQREAHRLRQRRATSASACSTCSRQASSMSRPCSIRASNR